jgi:hypothetical protein
MILVIDYTAVKAKNQADRLPGSCGAEIHLLRHIGESYLEMRIANKFTSLDRSVIQPL